MIVDFLEAVKAYINKPLPVNAPIKFGGLDITETGVAIRIIPSGAGERYFEGRTDLVNFQILVKLKGQAETINKISVIAGKLTQVERGEIPFPGGQYEILSCDVYTPPNEVERTKEGYIWTALFSAEIEKIGGR